MHRGNLEEEKGQQSRVKYRNVCRELCKMAEPIEMQFGMLSDNHVLDVGHIGTTW